MDHRSIKRPRSQAAAAVEPEEKGAKPTKPTKTKKKLKKSKSAKTNKYSNEEKTSSSGRVSMGTADADGQAMAQVLSTFNPMERVRFEAFKRSTFRGDAISSYVAHCLAASHERAYARGEKTRQLMGSSTLGIGGEAQNAISALPRRCPYIRDGTSSNGHNSSDTSSVSNSENRRQNGGRPKRSLEDMVAPGQSEEITVVVSTLAKAYAQRLVTAARRVASSNGRENGALSSRDILIAHQARAAAGLDPGFFLQPGHASTTNVVAGNSQASAAALGVVNRYELVRNAALAAQEEYDQQLERKGDKESGKQICKDSKAADEETKEMEIEQT